MRAYFTVAAFVISWFAIVSHTFPVGDEEDAALYLQWFGYLDRPPDHGIGATLGPDAISNALKDFQRFAGLNQTGELDNDTIIMMNTPRCGVRDIIGHSESARKKRYTLEGSRWKDKHLTYRITKYPTRLKNRTKVNEEIARAFKMWSDVSALTIEERKRGQAKIDIKFEIGHHGDNFPFVGPFDEDTLAHAFFPKDGGAVHFNDEENWTFDGPSGRNLLQIATHEFGHSLGLDHSDVEGAVMGPYYASYQPNFKLHSDDITAIQFLYGTTDQPAPTRPTRPPPDTSYAPGLCQDATMDTVTRTQDGSTYVFKGEFYWKVQSGRIADGYPRNISNDWDGLEGNLDASLTWSNGKTFFFKGDRYWRFTNKEMDSDFPKLIERGFDGIPDMIDAAFVWSGNAKTYFFKGNQYWRYDSDNNVPVSGIYPKLISNWNGLPEDGIDAAFQWENNRTYFFKGDKYYGFDDLSFEVASGDPPYPRPTSVWWFGCEAS